MGTRFVRQPSGRLARFSSIVDAFTHWDMTVHEAYDVAREDMGIQDALAKVYRGVIDSPSDLLRTSGHPQKLGRWEEALDEIRVVHGRDKDDPDDDDKAVMPADKMPDMDPTPYDCEAEFKALLATCPERLHPRTL